MDSNAITTVHAVHPRTSEFFHMIATSPERLKANKNASETQCTTCFMPGQKLQTCQRCKSVLYCSKECQKKDWPRHKTLCTPTDRPKCMRKLIENLICNNTLTALLQVCAVLDLDLTNDKMKEVGLGIPFVVHVDIAIEPSDVHDFGRLFLTEEPIPNKMEGMVQVNRVRAYIPGRSAYAPLAEMRDSMWRLWRGKLDVDPARRDERLGLIQFSDGTGFLLIAILTVTPGAVKMAREKKSFKRVSGLTGMEFESPMSVHACMEFINTHIRHDTQNQLKLRTEMSEADKATVRETRDKSTTRGAVVLLRQKMARELIYANIPLVQS